MSDAQQLVQTAPSKATVDLAALVTCIHTCFDCAQACTACAEVFLGEQDTTMLVRCMHLDLDCADVCGATGKIQSRQTGFDPVMARSVLQARAQACRLCADECERHAQHAMEHCRDCAEACRRHEQACNQLLTSLAT